MGPGGPRVQIPGRAKARWLRSRASGVTFPHPLSSPTEEDTDMTNRNYNVIETEKGVPIKAWTRGVAVEPALRSGRAAGRKLLVTYVTGGLGPAWIDG